MQITSKTKWKFVQDNFSPRQNWHFKEMSTNWTLDLKLFDTEGMLAYKWFVLFFSRRLKLLACRPRFSEGSPANTLGALPCVLLPPCYCKLPCHWILLTISHPNHHRSWKTSHFEVRTREVVWAPPLRQVLRLSLRWKLGWICESPRPEAFLDLLYDS